MFKVHSVQFLKDKSHLLNLFTLRFSSPSREGWAAGRLSRLRQPLSRLPVSLTLPISRNDQPSAISDGFRISGRALACFSGRFLFSIARVQN